MSASPHKLMSKWWDEAWSEGLWAAGWEKSIAALTPSQAAWIPAPGRHSIWQIVLHMVFWRESWLRREATGQKPSQQEIHSGNFPPLSDLSDAAWQRDMDRFRRTQQQVSQRLAQLERDGRFDTPLNYFVFHDCYHFGQINYLRAMQGLPPIE